jgi:hypothetical protein
MSQLLLQTPNLAALQRRQSGDSGWRGECGSRGRRLVTGALGRFGQDTPGRHHDRSAGAISLDWDSKARVTPAVTLVGDRSWVSLGFLRQALRRARLSNHRGARAEHVAGSRVAQAERWVATASAVVERREASVPPPYPPPQAGEEVRKGRALCPRGHGGYGTASIGVPLSFRHCEPTAKQSRLCALWIASSLTLLAMTRCRLSAHDRDGAGFTAGVI